MKARTTLRLTVSPEYVHNWGVWEAIREVLQNAKDEADVNGASFDVVRTGKGVVRIKNKGGNRDLTRDTLLLGTTSKRDDDRQRGQFGEGYKLALLVLARAGVPVKVRTKTETWTACIEHNPEVGADSLAVKIVPRTPSDEVIFDIGPISDKDWDTIQDHCLFLREPKADMVIKTSRGSILRDGRYENRLYCKGLYVAQMPECFEYGYDLDVGLDRDRKMAALWDLRYEVAKVLDEAVTRGADLDIPRMLRLGLGEAKAMSEYDTCVSNAARSVSDAFETEHGADAIPVEDMEQAAQAAQHGIKAVVVGKAERVLVEAHKGKSTARLQELTKVPSKVYQPHELTREELSTFTWACDLVSKATDKPAVKVVDFKDPKLMGIYESGSVSLARQILSSKRDTIATLVHEVAHRAGGDGTVEHRNEMENLFATIIVGAHQ